jgi:uncharacterized protein
VAAKPVAEHEIAELQALLDDVAAPLEPLDVCALDGFLCGVLVQPQAIAPARWLRFVTDVEGRPLPAGFDARRLHALVRRREAELGRAIEPREGLGPMEGRQLWRVLCRRPMAPSRCLADWGGRHASALGRSQ